MERALRLGNRGGGDERDRTGASDISRTACLDFASWRSGGETLLIECFDLPDTSWPRT